MSTQRAGAHSAKQARLRRERWSLLDQIVAVMRPPMTALAFLWAGLVIVGLVWGLPASLQWVSYAIWALFVLDFLLEIVIAPDNMAYLRAHWLTAISLLLPAFSALRVLQAMQVVRAAVAGESFSLLTVITAVNRGMAALRRLMRRRKVAYVAALTLLVTLAGGAGMYHFENTAALQAQGYGTVVQQGGGLHNYGEAIWWTAMVMTTLGSQYWPVTVAGRILCWFLALYALSVFGYITATVASFFIGSDMASGAREDRQTSERQTLRVDTELAALRQQVAELVNRLDSQTLPGGVVRETRPSAESRAGAPTDRDSL